MADDTNDTNEPDKLVPLVNHEARIYQLACYDAPTVTTPDSVGARVVQVRPTRKVAILPGLNFVSLAFLRACKFQPEDYQGRIVPQDVAQLPGYQAAALAAATTSKRALRKWRESESRPEVVKAIDERLASSKVQ